MGFESSSRTFGGENWMTSGEPMVCVIMKNTRTLHPVIVPEDNYKRMGSSVVHNGNTMLGE